MQRVERMLQLGLVREVETLFALGYGPELRPLRSIGYKQIGQYLSGTISLAEAVSRIQRETRRFAKRQLTWLRHDPDNIWVELPGGAPDVEAHAKKFLNLAESCLIIECLVRLQHAVPGRHGGHVYALRYRHVVREKALLVILKQKGAGSRAVRLA